MSTHAAFQDGVPEGVLEAEDFNKDVNPLTLLSHLEEVLSAHLPTLEDKSLIELSEGSMREELELNISETDATLKSSAKYLMTFMDTLSSLSQILMTLVKRLTDKLDKEFVAKKTGERKMTEEELRILQRNTEVYKDFADKATTLAALEKLADQIHEATRLLGQEVIRVQEEAAQARAALEEAERQAKLQAEQDKEREEAERKAEEELKRKAEDEKKEREEADRKAEEEREMQEKGAEKGESEGDNEKAEEERKRKEEARQQDEAKRNPANWPPFVYSVSDEDVTDTGLGCVLRVLPGNIEQKDITVSVVDQLNSTFSLGENEELVSNLIHIEVNEGAIYEFPYPPSLAIPNCAPRMPGREVVLRTCTDGESWTELPTKNAKLPDSPELNFVEGSLTTLCDMTLCAVSKIKIDRETFSKWADKMVSSVDSRVSIAIPKGSVRLNSEVSLQVEPVDSTNIAHVKAQSESMENLEASSYLVTIQAQHKFQKDVTVCVPSPGTSRRTDTSVPLAKQKGMSTPKILPTDSGKEDNETIILVWKRGQGDWQFASGKPLTQQKDLVTFDLDISPTPIRLLLLKIKQVNRQSHAIAAVAANSIEHTIKCKSVNVALRQKSNDMGSIYIEMCKSDRTEKLLTTLKTRGLNSGPQPSEEFLLTEGQMVEVRFRGNVTNDDDGVIRFPYNSYLATARRQIFVREVDRFAQHGRDHYRGYAQFLTVAPAPPKSNKTTKVDNNETSNDPISPEPPSMKLLTELPITLPKPPMRPPTLNRITVPIRDNGPLSEEYFRSLSAALGDEWPQLAESLGVQRARVESIKREYLEAENKDNVVMDVLFHWYKQTSRNADKVGELSRALREAGRLDLYDDLLDKNDTFQKQSEMRIENDKMQKAFKFVMNSSTALKDWKFLARELTVTDVDIQEISHKESGSPREQCYQMLQLWRDRSGDKATRSTLCNALKACQLVAPIEKIQQLR